MVACLPPVSRIVVTVSAGARESELVGRFGDGWKVRIAAAPERGQANDELRAFLARLLGVRREDVSIASGHGSRRKVVTVATVEPDELDQRLTAASTR